MSVGVGSPVYNDQNQDIVFFDKEPVQDFASWISGDIMDREYQNDFETLFREAGFYYNGAVYAVVCYSQIFLKRIYCEGYGLRLVFINQKYLDIFFHMMKPQE